MCAVCCLLFVVFGLPLLCRVLVCCVLYVVCSVMFGVWS